MLPKCSNLRFSLYFQLKTLSLNDFLMTLLLKDTLLKVSLQSPCLSSSSRKRMVSSNSSRIIKNSMTSLLRTNTLYYSFSTSSESSKVLGSSLSLIFVKATIMSRLKKGNKWKAIFIINHKLFEFYIMYFELCNSSAIFQALMNYILLISLLNTKLQSTSMTFLFDSSTLPLIAKLSMKYLNNSSNTISIFI